jgi:hypothetical protein
MTEPTADLLPLKLPHPSGWVPSQWLHIKGKRADGTVFVTFGAWHDFPAETLEAATELLAAVVPVVAAAVLEAEADVLDSIQVAPPLTGAQYLRMRAEKYRDPRSMVAAVPPDRCSHGHDLDGANGCQGTCDA